MVHCAGLGVGQFNYSYTCEYEDTNIYVLRDDEEYDYDFVHGFWKDEHEDDFPQWISSWKKYKRFGAIHHRKSFRTRSGI